MKNIKSSSIKDAKHHAQKQTEHIFYTGTVFKYHINSNGKDERILLITNLFVSYYSKKGEISKSNYWIDLKSISVQNKDKNILVNMKFDHNNLMKFECPSNSKVDKIIFESIKHMSTGQDIKIECNKAKINFSILPKSIFNLFISQILRSKDILPKTLKKSIRMICRLHSKIIGFMPNMIDKYFPFLLKSIVYSNYTESLRIPELDKTDVYKSLSEYLQTDSITDSSLFHIGIAKQDMTNFQMFCESISNKKSTNNKISALTFVNTEFDQESLKMLSESINNSSSKAKFIINSIGFENAIGNNVDFVKSFLPKSNWPIKYLSINRMRIDGINNFISLLKGIRVLSLSYMNIEVSSIFQSISKSGINNLNFLNVSGNFFNEAKSCVDILPSSLQRLDANEVNFFVQKVDSEKGNSMVDFFLSVLNKKWNSLFYLSFSHIFVHNNNEGEFRPDSSLGFLFSKLKKCKPSVCEKLKGLSFSGNFVNDDFFEFIKKCHNLKALFLNYTFATDSPFLSSFCDALKSSLSNLNVLSVVGDLSQNKVLGEKFTILCKALKKCKSLQCLIASDNLIGNKGVESLGTLFDRSIESDDSSTSSSSDSKSRCKKNSASQLSTLSSVCFENCNVGSIQPLLALAERAAATGSSVLLDYPTAEVWRLKETGAADKDQIKELRKKFEIAYLAGNDGNGTEKVRDEVKEVVEYWSKPFSEYKVPNNDFFPEYLSPQLLTEINSPEKANLAVSESEESTKKSESSSDNESSTKSSSDGGSSDKKKAKKSSKSRKMTERSDDDSNHTSVSSDDIKYKKKKKSSKKRWKRETESDEDSSDSDTDRNDKISKKKKTKSKKKRNSSSDSSFDESSDDSSGNPKRKTKSRKRKVVTDSDDDSDDEYEKFSRRRKTKSEKISKNLRKKRSEIFSSVSDSLSDNDENELDNYHKYKKSSKYKRVSKSFENDSSTDSEDDDSDFEYNRRKSSRKSSKNKIINRKSIKRSDSSDTNSDNESDDNQNYSLSIDPKKEKQIVKDIKKKFSLNQLRERIINDL